MQSKMQNLLNTLVRDRRERGVQVAVYHQGKLVIDAWAGTLDGRQPVDGRTLFPVFSVTKGMAATLLHILVERGQVSYETPLAEVWPEFAAQGKSGIRLRHALNHTAGLQYMPRGLDYATLCNWDAMCAVMAAQTPVAPSGTQMAYHAVTFSWLVGEVACRVTGRPFGELIQREICKPLGITDMYVGIPDEVEPRVAILDEIFENGKPPVVDDTQPQSIRGLIQPLHTMMNRPDARRACIPASNGIMSARALAKHYAALLPGGVEGVELLPPARVRQATQLQRLDNGNYAEDRGLGYGLIGLPADKSTTTHPNGPVAFGHGGYGGANGFADPRYGLAVGLTKNLYSPRAGGNEIMAAVREMLGIPQ
ncbi:MAG: serine hydrolase domain-containing protein [Phycisphaerae bacterium]